MQKEVKGNILITAVGSMSAQFAIKTLSENGFQVFGTDIHPKSWIANAEDVQKFFQVSRIKNDDSLFLEFLKICEENQIQYIIPLTDIEVDYFSQFKEKFAEHNIILCISDEEKINICRSKLNIYNLFKDSKVVDCIPTFTNSTIDIKNLNFPVICKQDRGRSSEGLFKIDKMEDFKLSDENFIYQSLIDGQIVTIDVLYDGNQIRYIARRELLRTSNGAGMTVEIIKNSKFDEILATICETLGLRGTFNVEFIEKDNKYYLMDVNPRFSAGVAFSKLAGYDFVLNHLNYFMDKDIEPLHKINFKIFKRKFIEL